MSDPTEPTEAEYLEGLRPDDQEQDDRPEPDGTVLGHDMYPDTEESHGVPEPDEPCGACGGPADHDIHNGVEFQGHEPHEYIALSVLVERTEGRLRDMTSDNVSRAKRLARGEPPMQLDSASMSALRLETILNHVLPPGTPQRLQFELYFQGEVSKALDEAFSEQAKLRLGVKPTGRTTPKGLHLG